MVATPLHIVVEEGSYRCGSYGRTKSLGVEEWRLVRMVPTHWEGLSKLLRKDEIVRHPQMVQWAKAMCVVEVYWTHFRVLRLLKD